MRFESRIFWLSKDADETAQYQDAFALDAETGRAAIADGVSSAIFSGPWARLLTLAAIADPPPLDDGAAFQTWLAEKRAAWANSVDASKLTWYQRPKMVDGAMTTLLWLDLAPIETDDQELALRYQLQVFAIGDSCLFHVRDGQPLYWFPLEKAAEFGLNPAVMASVDRQVDHLLEFKARSHDCLPDDLLVLATDAVALWAIERTESGENIDWARYWDFSDDAWRDEIYSLRDAKQMRFDDSTLVLLRVIEEQPAPVARPEEPIAPEEVIGPDLVASPDAPVEAEDAALVAQRESCGEEKADPTSLAEAVEPPLAQAVEPPLAQAVEPPVAASSEPVQAADVGRFDEAIRAGIEKLHEPAAVDDRQPDPGIADEHASPQPPEG